MPVVIFFAGLDIKQKSSFLDGHYLFQKLYYWAGLRLQVASVKN
jgi:hypothetical protein